MEFPKRAREHGCKDVNEARMARTRTKPVKQSEI